MPTSWEIAYSVTQKAFSGQRLIFDSPHQTASNQVSGIGFAVTLKETTLLARTLFGCRDADKQSAAIFNQRRKRSFPLNDQAVRRKRSAAEFASERAHC